MTRDIPHLVSIADQLGLTVIERRGNTPGGYHDGLARIRLDPGQSIRAQRSFLAHEIAHALFRDSPSPYAVVAMKQERRAWNWAARYLITPEGFALTERMREGHSASMAYDLGVTVELVEAYRKQLLRVDETVYVAPRMGSGQWSHRFSSSGAERRVNDAERIMRAG